jgi:hypothetical protein
VLEPPELDPENEVEPDGEEEPEGEEEDEEGVVGEEEPKKLEPPDPEEQKYTEQPPVVVEASWEPAEHEGMLPSHVVPPEEPAPVLALDAVEPLEP